MKSKFLRMLSLILILSFLVSMLTVFASAEEEVTEDTEDTDGTEEESTFKLLHYRTYDEGWDITNGLDYTENGGPETTFKIEYETTVDYEYNYFWRMEIGSDKNSFMQLDYDAQKNIGSVLEFDIMADDACTLNRLINFGTQGSGSADRDDYAFLKIIDNQIYVMPSGDYSGYKDESDHDFDAPVVKLGTEWVTFKLVFDYEYEKSPILETDTPEQIEEKNKLNNKWFQLYIYYGPADGSEELTLLGGAPLVLRGQNGKGLQMFRFETSGEDESNFGTSVCFDNIKAYTGTNQITEITPDMGYGSLVNEFAEKNITILGATQTASAFQAGLSMKVGVDYCYLGGKRVAIDTNVDGEAFGAPVVVDGKVMIHLDTLLDHLGYPAYIHPDGMYIDISTGTSATYIVVGKDTATVDGKSVQLSTAPVYITDEDGNTYLAIDYSDVNVLFPGNYACYDDMGYIIISTVENLLDRNINLTSMVDTMKKFVFDYATGDEIYEDVKANTNNFEHPYLFGSKEQIDIVHEEYKTIMARNEEFEEMDNNYNGNPADYPEEFWLWVHYIRIEKSLGDGAYKVYALPDENGEYDTFVGVNYDDSSRSKSYSLAQPDMQSSGYDVGGRSSITNRTSLLKRMGIAYAVTRDIKYLQCAYEVALVLGEWTHWGPGHFLNCADSSADFAAYFDLTYNGYKELAANGITRSNGEAYDTDVLATILFNQGVHEGYLATFEKTTDHVSPSLGVSGALYSHRDNNWNAVCTSGMGAAALAVMGECDGKFYDESTALISDNIATLIANGMQQYVPDGAYIEGPGYWNYGTNSFFRLCMMLDSAAGTNYGLMDTWGIDKTCYFACHAESSDSRTFNFADGAMSSQETEYFFYVANTYNDATLYDVRLNQINGNMKTATLIDLIYYPRDMEIEAEDIQLDYMPDSIDMFATRSGWEQGSLYAAIAGGNNMFGHGQIDAGSFVYHNGGNVWIIDLGTEEYNCEGFWPAATRYRFYVMKPEGNNTLAISSSDSVPYGQILDSTAPAIGSGSNEYGAYVIYNMKDTFGARATMWTRGMLLTNDRKTTIIQDELVLDSAQNVYWFAHYYLQNGNQYSYGVEKVEISSDGKTAYLQQYMGLDEYKAEKYQTLRLTIISPNPALRFEIMDAYTTIHPDEETGTYQKDYIGSFGNGVKEKDRSRYRKLAIGGGKVLELRLAVVIEMIDTETAMTPNEIEVGYNFTDMAKWVPSTDMRGQDIGDTVERRGTPNVNTHLIWGIGLAEHYLETGDAYNTMIHEYYRALTDAHYVVRMLGADLPASYKMYSDSLKQCKEHFTAYREEIMKLYNNQSKFAQKLMGLEK